jgi:hypothetical protein|tara:strand:+ start:1651 stop:2262 length:612 start_codon:yes stop_codon:yes gene_type:complete
MLMSMFAGSKLLKVILWALVVAAIIGSILWAVNHYEAKGRALGIAETEAKWSKLSAEAERLSKKNSEEAAKILSERGKEFNRVLDSIAKTNNRDKKNAERAKNMAVAAARNGSFRLFDNYAEAGRVIGGNNSEGNDQEGGLSATTTGTDGQGRRRLSTELATFLVSETSEADRITVKLGKLQDYTRELFNSCSSRKSIFDLPW